MEKIIVAMVTYNRRTCLEKALDGIEKQKYKVDTIVIVDNNSTDDTYSFISTYLNIDTTRYLTFTNAFKNGINYLYFRNNVNAGGSGGFAIAIQKAIELDGDYIWIMDDDVYPNLDCLQLMLCAMNKDVKACIPNRTDENFEDHACRNIDFSSPLKFRMYMRKQFYTEPLNQQYYLVKDMAFEGPLISTNIIRKVGLPETGFFIEYDDTDYAQRILQYTQIRFVTNAILHRQLAKKKNQKEKKNRSYNWRSYYAIRNNILFNHKYGRSFGAKHIDTILLWIYHVLKSIYFHEFGNIKIINRAVKDGISEKYGKIVNPGEW